MSIWKRNISLDELNRMGEKTMVARLGIIFTHMDDESLTAEMPVDERTHQPFGLLHGGAGRNAGINGWLSDNGRRAVRGRHRDKRQPPSGRGVRHRARRL